MATKAMNGKTETATPADLSDQIEILRKDLSDLTSTIAGLGRAKGEEAINAAKARASTVRAAAGEQVEAAQLQAQQLRNQADQFVREQPGMALGIAAGVGFLVGFFSTRK